MEQRRLELLAWLHQVADATGECDRCHADSVGLWSLPDDIDMEHDADWLYCKKCFTVLINRHFK